MTCKDCSTQVLCKGEVMLCKVKPTKQKPATWTDSPAIGGFPKLQEPSKEPRWIVYGLVGVVAFVLTVKYVFS